MRPDALKNAAAFGLMGVAAILIMASALFTTMFWVLKGSVIGPREGWAGVIVSLGGGVLGIVLLYVATGDRGPKDLGQRRLDEGRCPKCYYDLRGTREGDSGCPECGWGREEELP